MGLYLAIISRYTKSAYHNDTTLIYGLAREQAHGNQHSLYTVSLFPSYLDRVRQPIFDPSCID